MSEIIRDESISTESLCTVIENDIGKSEKRENPKENSLEYKKQPNGHIHTTSIDLVDNKTKENGPEKSNGHLNTSTSASLTDDTAEYCDTTTDTEPSTLPVKPRTKFKKSVSFDPNDEKIQKFVSGEPIVDQQNPFKNAHLNGNASKKKRTPPPVPTKRSTLSIKKTVTQQLREREREREKEKERERLKNEANKCKTQAKSPTSPDDFITTEEVLNQSKYVKTYIKNPDPFFVYDPTVLARLKFEELRELADKKPPKKLKLSIQTRERLKDLKNKTPTTPKSKVPTYKKVSKPNYPELSDIKIKVGTKPDGNYFNPAEVTKNAKKFDERVKKLHIDSDVDLDEIEEPLTKSESSDEVTVSSNHNNNNDTTDGASKPSEPDHSVMNGFHTTNDEDREHTDPGTFTSTITSREFQQYLEKKGLTLIPRKIPSGALPLYANGGTLRPSAHVSFRTEPEENAQISIDAMDASRQDKKPSVFQRLLANSIFASRRNKTTPKETVPNPRSLYEPSTRLKDNGSIVAPTPIKRVVLERQSFHGRPRVSNLLTAAEARELQQQNERSRKSFASGDDISLSISSALTNAEYANESESRRSLSGPAGMRRERSNENGQTRQPVSKPPRRSLSGDRLSNSYAQEHRSSTLIKPKVQRAQLPNASTSRRTERSLEPVTPANNNPTQFRRTLERQSLIPKRTTQEADKRQAFGRSASMDRNEIMRRNANRRLQNRSNSANESLKVPANSKENLHGDFGPKLTSTPRQAADRISVEAVVHPTERKIFSPVLLNSAKPGNVYVDQQEWERLRAIKERTDRELYYRVLQQQQQQQQQQVQQQHQQLQQQQHQQQHQLQQQQLQQQQLRQQQQQKRLSDPESIYEHLKPNQVIIHEPPRHMVQVPVSVTDGNFVRGSPQRNTFSGITQNRQVKIIDGRAIVASENPDKIMRHQQQTPRSQSVLDNMTTPNRHNRRGYESDNETPVVLRRKGPLVSTEQLTPQRRIGGILTREEILQKVKEFCRKSLNKTPIVQQPQMQAIYETQPTMSTDISPVSYASVERIGARMYAAPQVPQRMQSLPQQFVPITQETLNESTTSPIYAHVVKRSSLQSNQSEVYDNPQRPAVFRRESDAQGIYVRRAINGSATLQRGSVNELLIPTQYIVVDSDKIAPTQLLNYYAPQQQVELYAQPQYVRPHQLQQLPGPYGYVTVRDPMLQPQQQQQHVLRQPVRFMDGRSTPLILESSSSPQQASQIYWTPQHQRLQQQAGLLPVHISPRYVVKQSYPTQASRPEPIYPQQQTISRFTKSGLVQGATNIPTTEKINRNFSPNLRTNTPTKNIQFNDSEKPIPQPRPFTLPNHKSDNNQNIQQAYEWESGSEAGEVQRIMERQRDSGGESKVNTILRNLKSKVSQFIRSSSSK